MNELLDHTLVLLDQEHLQLSFYSNDRGRIVQFHHIWPKMYDLYLFQPKKFNKTKVSIVNPCILRSAQDNIGNRAVSQ